MLCPYCDSVITEVPNSGVCPRCGGSLGVNRDLQERQSLNEERSSNRNENALGIPCGTYKGISGGIILNEENLCIWCSILGKKYETTFSYNKLTKILFIRTGDYLDKAYLLLRGEDNKDVPVPRWDHLCLDTTTVTFANNLLFQHIYYLLTVLAPESAETEIINLSKGIRVEQTIVAGIDLEPYFQKYNPYRDVAVKALIKNMGLKKKDAKRLVEGYFDERQKALYAQNPDLVYEDLHMILKRMDPQ